MSAAELRPFSPRTLLALIGIGAAAFVAMAYFMATDDGQRMRGEASPGASARSALGYRAFVELMKHLDVPVVPPGGNRVSLQIVLAPRSAQALDALLLARHQTLVVLPKWRGYARPYGDHLAAVQLLELETVRAIARVAVEDVEIVRPTSAGPWRNEVFHGQPTLDHLQLVRSDKLCPLVSSGDDMLIARVCRRPWIFVLADPDLIANHGLWRGDNAILAMSAISELRNGSGPVVPVDSAVRAAAPTAPSIWRLALEPPFVLITFAALIAIAIAAWLAAQRFGPANAEGPDRPPGVQTLIDVAARLLSERAGEPLLRRYAELVTLDLGRRLHAPRTLASTAEIGAWLDAPRRGAASGLSHAGLTRRIDTVLPAEVVATAAELHRWREEILDGR